MRRQRVMFGGLTRDFGVFWFGQTLSLVGSQVSSLAIPLAAIVALGAGPGEMGLLQAARFVPFLLFALPVGVLVDRIRRRPVLVAADLGRAIVLALIPVAAFLGTLRIELLYAVAFAAGALSVLFEVAYITVAPTLVPRHVLVRANARLMTSQSFSEVAGPPLAGQLVQILTAPIAILVDALSFMVGAAAIAAVGTPEPNPAGPFRGSLAADVREGFGAVFRNPYVRGIGLMAATYNLVETGILTLLVLFATDLGFGPAVLGAILGAGAIGALIGSLVAEPLGARIGIGPTTVVAMLIETVVFMPLALVPDASPLSAFVVAAALFVNGAGVTVSTVHSMSVRQHVTAPALLGRMNASYRLLVTGTVPFGAVIAGALGESIGVRVTLLLFSALLPLSLIWIALSPLPRLRSLSPVGAGV